MMKNRDSNDEFLQNDDKFMSENVGRERKRVRGDLYHRSQEVRNKMQNYLFI